MLTSKFVNAALKEDFSLEYNGKPVATIHKAGFADPNYHAKCDFIDKKTADQMLKARKFDGWLQVQRNANKEPSDKEIVSTMAEIGLEKEYYNMRHGNLWATKDSGGVVTAINIMDMDNTGVEWRPGKVIFRPKTLLPHWAHVILNILYFIIFLVVLAFIHNAISK
jgi:hypothetical protein